MKRTKKQKIKATARRVNSQLEYKFSSSYSHNPKKINVDTMDKSDNLGSIKKELFKTLIIASLTLISLLVIYWLQK